MNLKLSLLTAARASIESGYDTYICDAIHSAHEEINSGESLSAYLELTRRITEEINSQFGLGDWLRNQIPDGHVTCEQLTRFNDRSPTLRQCRLAWLDKLILEQA